MARVCPLTGKKVMSGNRVSHANNRTHRKFLPNLQTVSFLSDALGMNVQIKMSTQAMRTVEKNGGIDNYLLKAKTETLAPKYRQMKKVIKKKILSA